MTMLINRVLTQKPARFHERAFNEEEMATLVLLSRSVRLSDRILCAEWLKEASEIEENKPFILELADLLIEERSSTIRWGLVAYTLSPTLNPWQHEELWPFAAKWGLAKSRDIRCAIGVSIVENCLAHDFKRYFELSRQIIDGGGRRFALTLAHAFKTGEAKEPDNAAAFDSYVGDPRFRINLKKTG